MSRRCELTGVGPMVGHNVSHSNIKSKRRFLPALSPATLQSDALGQSFRLRISNAALRTLDFRGGLDIFLGTYNYLSKKSRLAAVKFTTTEDVFERCPRGTACRPPRMTSAR